MNKIEYTRKVHYYETDQMGIVHHSNYIRWFEEARIYYLEQIGLPYDLLEEKGILIPVLSVSCEYKNVTRFNDAIFIVPSLISYNGLKLDLYYEVYNSDHSILHSVGNSSHCLLNKDFKPIHTKRDYPEVHEILSNCLK